jgi:hypothetical protein
LRKRLAAGGQTPTQQQTKSNSTSNPRAPHGNP